MKRQYQMFGCRTRRCKWVGTESELLVAPHPFEAEGTIHGCPLCKTVDNYAPLCDEEGCLETATCGTPVQGDYRTTCNKHAPRPT
jgi:hypothetical protein